MVLVEVNIKGIMNIFRFRAFLACDFILIRIWEEIKVLRCN